MMQFSDLAARILAGKSVKFDAKQGKFLSKMNPGQINRQGYNGKDIFIGILHI